MTVKLTDGNRVQVAICDEHYDEDAPPSAIREAYLRRLKEIEELTAKAERLGLQITTRSSGLVVATQVGPAAPDVNPAAARPFLGAIPAQRSAQPTPAPVAAAMTQDAAPDSIQQIAPALGLDPNDQGVKATSVADHARGMVSVGGATPMGAAGSYRNLNLLAEANRLETKDGAKLPAGALSGRVKMETVRGRAGTEITVPTRRLDGLGYTQVRVQQDVTDIQLQRRFKDMAEDSKRGDGSGGPDFRHEYAMRSCTMCGGEGIVFQHGKIPQECEKCHGTGQIEVG